MTLGTQEHYDILASFEKYIKTTPIRTRFDKEEKGMWRRGNIYQDGNTNDLFKLYSAGYANARCVYMSIEA